MGLIDLIRVNLDNISRRSVNEADLQLHLQQWRRDLARFVIELSELRRSSYGFLHFLKSTASTQPGVAILNSTLDDISRALDACEKSQALLASSISILESRRSVQQAESVGRLTELGFVFLPTSLASSLFSMQIHELQMAPPPFWTFLITALGLLATAYIARWMVSLHLRTRIIRSLRQYWANYYKPPTWENFVCWAIVHGAVWVLALIIFPFKLVIDGLRSLIRHFRSLRRHSGRADDEEAEGSRNGTASEGDGDGALGGVRKASTCDVPTDIAHTSRRDTNSSLYSVSIYEDARSSGTEGSENI